MKNLYDLQREINKVCSDHYRYNIVAIQDKYSMWRDIKLRTANYKDGTTLDIFSLNMNTNKWAVLKDFVDLYTDLQAIIVEFLATTDPEEWFDDDKKYNIIIGQYYDTNGNVTQTCTAYKKGYKDCIQPVNNVDEKDLLEERFQFTEREIEKIKSKLPESMAEIVEWGKVEVKKEKNSLSDNSYTRFKNQFKERDKWQTKNGK